jgi:hypothetical protein
LLGCIPKPLFQYRQVQKNKSASSHMESCRFIFHIFLYSSYGLFKIFCQSAL